MSVPADRTRRHSPPVRNGDKDRPLTHAVRTDLERDGRLAVVTLDRPPLNVLDLGALADLESAVAALEPGAGRGGPQVVVIRSASSRAFSAGVAVQDHTPDKLEEMLARFHGGLRRLRALPAVSIAAVGGHCLGGGMELALACDLVVAEEGARFAQPEIDLGCYPPFAAALYPALVGPRRALDLLVTGRALTAAEAERWGLVARLAPDGELDRAVDELVEILLGKSAAVLALTKRACRAGDDEGPAETGAFERALAGSERIYLEELAGTEDMEEGLAAFLDKRRPEWKHR